MYCYFMEVGSELDKPYTYRIAPIDIYEIVNSPDERRFDIVMVDEGIGRPLVYVSGSPLETEVVIANYDPETMHKQPLLLTSHLPSKWINKEYLPSVLHFPPDQEMKGQKLHNAREMALLNGPDSDEVKIYRTLYEKEVNSMFSQFNANKEE